MGAPTLLRSFAAAVLSGLLLTAAPTAAQSFPKLAGNPVVDQADIIPAPAEAALNAQLLDLQQKTGHQLVVATVNDLEGNDVADYGYRLGREWQIGDKEKDDGVVFLIAPNERRMNISVGYGLEPILTDALSGRIIRDVVTPKFKAGDMPGGIQDGVNAIAQQIQLAPEEAAARAAAADKAERNRADDGDWGGLFFIGFIVFFFFILPMLTSLGRRGKKRRKHSPWGAPIVIWGGDDDDWGGWGGGGSSWGGGGGGFGGFSGGGGSFGGGGASGGW
ncbi:TPM domain-containing protein [Sphingopyxis sp. RIFCSPHIGHO2_12_FULL_65_19]|uniref:TPM domain-containing protein n=1 Tax=Sphingopyxis sp. RIFCSPHIGHO2_12_FULL_65_19 TaxID=1802172 RepID=UPI000B078A36|nr:TPM domain-containing protein [Sphingopyxis sp. RIFCSPHIGHO2_12_FULL_65_19]